MIAPSARTRWASALAAATLALAAAASATAAPVVSVTPASQDAEVGAPFRVTATITNPDTESSAPLTAHLEIIDPTRAGSVDAEDWVPDLNTPVGRLAPGTSKDITWELVPISGGTFAVYVVTLPEASGATAGQRVASSDAIPVAVAEVRTLNAGGALPVSLAVPLALLFGLLALRLRARRGEARAVVDGA